MSQDIAAAPPQLGSLDEACARAMAYQLRGHGDLADQVYRAILAAQPGHPAAGYGLALLLLGRGDAAAALDLLGCRIDRHPEVAEFRLAWLDALLQAGRPELARSELAAARAAGHQGPAFALFEQRLPPPPAAPATATVAAQKAELTALLAAGRRTDALALAQHLTRRAPRDGEGWKALGALLWAQQRDPQAAAALDRATRLLPHDLESWVNLGKVHNSCGDHRAAEQCFRKALALHPDSAAAHEGLGIALMLQQRLAAAEDAMLAAVRCSAAPTQPLSNLGVLYTEQGRIEDALASFRRVVALEPDLASVHSSLLFLLTHQAGLSSEAIFAEHVAFGERFEAPLRRHWRAHDNPRDPARRLRVGMVSGDLFHHPVSHFLAPLLPELRAHADLELHAYYNHELIDDTTTRLRQQFQHWSQVGGMDDAALAERIRADGIDVLIDLSGHTRRNRLLTFAHRPAPVQASWIGYAGTTGLQAIDYYICDAELIPRGHFDRQFTERLVRLPCSVPFLPAADGVPTGSLPALSGRAFTFGSFNRTVKINDRTLALWCRVLEAVPDARLLFANVNDAASRTRFEHCFAARGIDPGRIEYRARTDLRSYLQMYQQVDACLDTWPYTGGTTTYHAITMGVPTLTLAGETAASRQSASVMSHFGIAEFVAADADQLVDIARRLPQRLEALAALRTGLPLRWQTQPELHPDRVAAQLARAWRRMWARWCSGAAPAPIDLSRD